MTSSVLEITFVLTYSLVKEGDKFYLIERGYRVPKEGG